MDIKEQIARTYSPEEIADNVSGDLFLIKANIGDPFLMTKAFISRHQEKLRNNPEGITKGLVFYEVYYDVRTEKHNGHWAALALKGKEAYFFDSIGSFPDEELALISKARMDCNHNRRHIGLMLYDLSQAGYRIHYNSYKFQENVPQVSTCGRYCIMFLEEAIKTPNDPYTYMKNALEVLRKPGEKYYDGAIVRYRVK